MIDMKITPSLIKQIQDNYKIADRFEKDKIVALLDLKGIKIEGVNT